MEFKSFENYFNFKLDDWRKTNLENLISGADDERIVKYIKRDSTTDNRIRFIKGEDISDDDTAYSSRSITKIKPQTAIQNIDDLIQAANEILKSFREKKQRMYS